MRHLILLICLCIAGIAAAQPYKVEDDFTKGTVRNVTGKGKFSGVLPSSWVPDFPGWNSCVARGELINEGPENFLRIHVEKLDSQRVQLARPIPPLSKEAKYRLTIQYRNRTNDSAELLIRQQSGSYSTFWKTRLPVAREWKKMTFYPELSQKPEWKGMGIYLYLGSAGTFDIVSLRLEECSAEEAANAGAKIFRPSPELPNFLRNSRLPLGPQSGWSFDRNTTPDWRISEEPGPSGAPYLTFRDTALNSEPFQVAEPGQEHFISFFYKGKGKAVIPWRTVELPQSESWKRVVLPILPGASLKGFSFILIADGALSVDAFQVSRRRGEYRSAGECEVALALPESQTANARIQFEDEPPEIRYLLTGKTDGVELAVTVADLYGRTGSFTVAPKTPAGAIAFHRFPDAPLGQFRVEVQARKDGKAVSPVNELVVTRLPRPKYWGKFAPNSPFGIHALPNAQTLLTLKAGGINATRLHDAGNEVTGWAYLEPEKGKWEFRDAEIDCFRNHFFTILGGLTTAPAWATDVGLRFPGTATGEKKIEYRQAFTAPRNPDDFANAVKTIVSRYQGKIDEYFVWNEPWSNGFFGQGYDEKGNRIPFEDAAKAYAELQKTAFQAAKSADREVKISGYNTVDGPKGADWNRRLAGFGASRYCDIIDFHFYMDRMTGFPGDAGASVVRELRQSIEQAGGKPFRQKIYMTEGQGASKSAFNEALGEYVGIYRNTLTWENTDDNAELAELQARYLMSLIAAGADKIYLYSAHTYTRLTAQPNFLALLQADGYAHPQLVAVSALALRIEDKKLVRWLKPAPGVHVALFSDGRESTAVIAPERNAGNMRLMCSLPGVKAADLYGNPLTLPSDGKGRLWYLTAAAPPDRLANAISASVK